MVAVRAADSQVGLKASLTWSACGACPCGSTAEDE